MKIPEKIVFNEFSIEIENGVFVMKETRWRVWENDEKGYQDQPMESALIPPKLGEALMKTLIEQIKFQNKVISTSRELAGSAALFCSVTSDGEVMNCKV